MSGEHLLALHFTEGREAGIASLQAEWPASTLRHAAEADEMVEQAFEEPHSIPLMVIGSPFQLTVWEHLRRIPAATTLAYGEVAKAIGRPTAARAVGQAVGANKIAILIPCHRVVSRGKSGGKLTGYRWGLDRKMSLLAWELSRRDPIEIPF